MADAGFPAAQDGRHEEFLFVLVGHKHGGLVVAGLVAIVDDVGGIVCKLLFLTEIAVMHNRVDMADGAVETDLVEVVIAARVVQVEQAAVLQRLRQNAVRETLLCQVLQNLTFINVMVSVQVELLVLETDFLVGFQGVVVAVRAENDLPVVEGENGVQVGVVVVGDLLQSVGKQVVNIDVGLAHPGGGQHNLAALVGVGKRTDLLEIKQIGTGFLAAIDVQIVQLDFAFFLQDERQDFAVGMPSQQRKRGVNVLVGAVAGAEKLLSLARLQVFKPKADFALVVADVGYHFPVRTDARLRESAVFPVFQRHDIGGLVGQQHLVARLVERKPFIDQLLVFLASHVEQGLTHVLRVFGQGQDVVERLAAVFLVDEVPEGVACNLGILVLQVVDSFVVA